MNVTLSIDEEVLARARELAAQRGTSVNQLIRDYLQEIAADLSPNEVLAELEDLWTRSAGDSGGPEVDSRGASCPLRHSLTRIEAALEILNPFT